MTDQTLFSETNDQQMSRRQAFKVGGITIGLAALVASCAEGTVDAKPARVGDAAAKTKLPDVVVNDGVLLRTASSMHYSIIDAHNQSKKLGKLSDAQTAVVDAYIAANQEAIATLDTLTTEAGGEVYGCANVRFDRVVLTPLVDRITGRAKRAGEEADIPATDDANRDAMALAHAMETVGAAMHQSMVQSLSEPARRGASIALSQAAARRAAVLALAINPANLINPVLVANANPSLPPTVGDAATTQQYYAIPSQFGILSSTQLQIGKFSEAGTQFALNIDTPSLNSYVYDGETC